MFSRAPLWLSTSLVQPCVTKSSRDQLLGLWLQAKYSFTDVTCCQVWSAGLGHERSRSCSSCGGQHQHVVVTHRSADRQLDIVLPLFAGWPATFAWDAIQMWIACGATILVATSFACLRRSSGHQTLSYVTHCHGFQTVVHSLSWLAVLFVDVDLLKFIT